MSKRKKLELDCNKWNKWAIGTMAWFYNGKKKGKNKEGLRLGKTCYKVSVTRRIKKDTVSSVYYFAFKRMAKLCYDYYVQRGGVNDLVLERVQILTNLNWTRELENVCPNS